MAEENIAVIGDDGTFTAEPMTDQTHVTFIDQFSTSVFPVSFYKAL